jgi:ABC-type uncharacterized transport system substrate-binding protein
LTFTLVEFLLLASAVSLLAPIAFTQTIRPKRVLVLYWDNKEFPGNLRFEESFKAQLQLGQRDDLEYYPEYFEFSRFPEDNHIKSFHKHLQAKYSDRAIDVVVASADAPLDFLLQHRATLFPNSPIVFVAKDLPSAGMAANPANATGIHYENAYRETLHLAVRLHPQTKQVFVVSGSPQQDRRFEKDAQLELTGFGKVDITYLTDLPLNDLISRTRSLPPNSVILYVWQQTANEQGKLLESYEVLSRIAPESSAPIYGFGTVLQGHGIVGGYLQGPEMNGAKAAEIVDRILSGAQARDIPVVQAQRVPMFDWRQLRRWGIPESSLPPDSVVRFKEFTFWEVYRGRIIGLLILLVLQTGFILVLLVERRRRRRAR